MSGRVSVFLPVPGDADAARERFVGDPGDWLPQARACGPARWTVPVHYRGLTRTVEVHVGAVWSVGDTLWRSLTWHPLPDDGDVGAIDRLLPTLSAELGIHLGSGGPSLVLTGSYDPPGALLGELADAVVLHRVAERTALGFLEELAPVLGRSEVVAV